MKFKSISKFKSIETYIPLTLQIVGVPKCPTLTLVCEYIKSLLFSQVITDAYASVSFWCPCMWQCFLDRNRVKKASKAN